MIKINNIDNIIMPIKGKINSYNINDSIPSFFIKNHYLTTIEKIYKIILPNPITIPKNNTLCFDIKISKQLFTSKTNYEIKNFDKNIKNLFFNLQLKSLHNNISENLIYEPNNIFSNIIIKEYCGWIIIKCIYNNNIEICNLYEINYNLSFSPFKLKIINFLSDRNIIINSNKIEINLKIINCDLNINIDDYKICNQEKINIQPIITSSSNILGFIWTGPNNFIQQNNINLDFFVDSNNEGNYTLKVIDNNYCVMEKTIYIQINNELQFRLTGLDTNGYGQDETINLTIVPLDSSNFNPISYEYNLYNGNDTTMIINGYGDSNDTTIDNLITIPLDTNIPEDNYKLKVVVLDNNCKYTIWEDIIIYAIPQFRLTGLDTNGYNQNDTNDIVLQIEPIGNDTIYFSPISYITYTLIDTTNSNNIQSDRIDTNDLNNININIDTNIPEGTYTLTIEIIDENNSTYLVTENIYIYGNSNLFQLNGLNINGYCHNDTNNIVLQIKPIVGDISEYSPITYTSYSFINNNDPTINESYRFDSNNTESVVIELDTNLPEGTYTLTINFIDNNNDSYSVQENIIIHDLPEFTIDQLDSNEWYFDTNTRTVVINPNITNLSSDNIIYYEYEVFGGDTNVNDSTYTGDSNTVIYSNTGTYLYSGIYDTNGIEIDFNDMLLYPSGDYLIKITLIDENGCEFSKYFELLNI